MATLEDRLKERIIDLERRMDAVSRRFGLLQDLIQQNASAIETIAHRQEAVVRAAKKIAG